MTVATPSPVDATPIVVVVDDDRDVLTATGRALRNLRLDVRLFGDAREALHVFATARVAVLLSDYNMPLMTGVELVAEVMRQSPATVRVLMTGRHDSIDAVAGITPSEIFRFVEKPFNVVELRTTVTDAVARHGELVTGSSLARTP